MRALVLSLALLASPLAAHEFWIEPLDYQIAPDGKLRGHLVNGQFFEGPRQPYLPQRYRHFVQVRGAQARPVVGRLGDLPALDTDHMGPGLNVVIYVANTQLVDYEDFDAFQRFADHKDFPDIEARHREAGFPMEDFAEAYSRYAKALIAVGEGAGEDRRMGLETEFVALTNPYTDDLTDGMAVQLFYRDGVRADAQVEVFEKHPDGEVLISLYRTDSDGIARFPVKPGHAYLVDGVVLRQPSERLAEASGAVWETLWAALTFATPGEAGPAPTVFDAKDGIVTGESDDGSD